ncbi:MAG: OmpA family protein [Bacteroidales bacterium]
MKFYGLILLSLLSLPLRSQEFILDTLSVYYPIDITVPDAQGKKRLDSLSALVKRNPKAVLTIIAYADYLGRGEHNKDLSDKRSSGVKEYLLAQGIDQAQIKQCTGRGALPAPSLVNNQKGIPAHRRTDIIVSWPVMKKPAAQKNKNSRIKPEQFTSPKKDIIDIKNLKSGSQLVLKNLNFVGGRHTLIPQSYPVLQELTDIMKDNPTLKIEIHGHICCDSVSDDGYDYDSKTDDLSVQRAKAVYNYLQHSGIDTNRITYKGFGGKKRLVKDERSEADRNMNRRVEIKILDK